MGLLPLLVATFPAHVVRMELQHQPCARTTISMQAPAALGSKVPGTPQRSDEDDFRRDPRGFCEQQLRRHGTTFACGVYGGSTFVGDAETLVRLGSSAVAPSSSRPKLSPPFAQQAGDGDDLFEAHAKAFNEVCYATIFEWIPKYKEAGFSTFRFEDFIDGRVRKLLPSMRQLVLRSAAPALLGRTAAELPAALGFESAKALEKAYAAHAAALASPSSLPFGLGGIGLPTLPGIGGGGDDAEALRRGLASLEVGGGSDGSEALWHLTSSVEQTAALICNMLAAATAHPEAAKAVAAEQVRGPHLASPCLAASRLSPLDRIHLVSSRLGWPRRTSA